MMFKIAKLLSWLANSTTSKSLRYDAHFLPLISGNHHRKLVNSAESACSLWNERFLDMNKLMILIFVLSIVVIDSTVDKVCVQNCKSDVVMKEAHGKVINDKGWWLMDSPGKLTLLQKALIAPQMRPSRTEVSWKNVQTSMWMEVQITMYGIKKTGMSQFKIQFLKIGGLSIFESWARSINIINPQPLRR